MPVLRSLIGTRQLDPNITDHQNRTALSWAVESRDLTIVDLLLTRPDIRVNPIGIYEDPILWLAIKYGRVNVVRKLLQHPKVDLNHGWGSYEPPLLFSIEKRHAEITLLLLAEGERLDVNRRNNRGETALLMAVRRGSLSVVDGLLQHCRVEVNSIDNKGRTALWWAASDGNCAMVSLLLTDHRIQIDIEDEAKQSPLMVARQWGHTEVALQLQFHMGL
ncbi:ankyrin repeat-containing domain protein [Aspergillus unguis]